MGDRAFATELFNKGVSVSQDKTFSTNLSTAWQLFTSSVYADPTFGQAWYQNGCNCNDNPSPNDLSHAAVACFRRSLECTDLGNNYGKALTNLAWKLHGLGRDTEALEYVNRALAYDPNLAGAWCNLSQIIGTLGDTKLAAQHAKRALDMDPDNTVYGMAYAFALLFDRQFKAGFDAFEVRFRYQLSQFLAYPYPKWRGEEGKTLLLVSDQGLGDTLTFARFVEETAKRCEFVHIGLQSELMRVFANAFVHIPNINLLPTPFNFPEADYWTTFVSLPHALDLNDYKIRKTKHIPPIVFRNNGEWKVPDRKLHIGIQYKGSAKNEIDKHRSIDVRWFLELYRVPGVQLYSLQVGPEAQDVVNVGAGMLVKDLSPYIRDVADTFSMLEHLDMVICIESSLAHMASTMDMECWIPYSWSGRDYRLGWNGSDILWSPRHRTFNQLEGEGWQPVFDRIVEALKEKVDGLAAERVS